MNESYLNAVRLLLEVGPTVFRNPLFALKGGTAINLFVRDMPRLSVDLDLVIADHTKSRDDALEAMSAELESIRSELVENLGLRCELGAMSQGSDVKLFAELPAALTGAQRAFLLGVVKGEPDWSLMTCAHLRDMPAIRWKLENLSRLEQSNPEKFALQASEFEVKL